MRPIISAARLARPLARTAPFEFKSPAGINAARTLPRQSVVLQQLPRRPLSTSRPTLRNRYERWDGPSFGQPGGANNVYNFARRRMGGDRGVYLFGILTAGGIIYYALHLERVPETGRLRFMDCSAKQEKEMGIASYDETMQQFGGKLLPPNHPDSVFVRGVATRIIERNGLGVMGAGQSLTSVDGAFAWLMGKKQTDDDNGDLDSTFSNADPDDKNADSVWETYVVDDPKTLNAFVIPGGKIFVFTGILPVAENQDGLATVLGHEVAHVVARHGAERMSMMKVLFGVGFLLEALGLDVGFTRILLTFLLQLPNSRTNETEADTIGLRLMAKACFDPREAPKLWERMSQASANSKFDFMSTHPANAKRIKALTKEEPEALAIRNANCTVAQEQTSDFKNAQDTWRRGGWA